ncbi:unnamed protein product [Rotaria magnacalcarata]|uniref:Uncharacterized protein n=1 Tax=Rotaria magnacalcarata TaxID=392030 RepID=A0A816SKQ8_9BILA|nr:unnamed protein product [Rotaria magnacalcarata]
MQLYSRSPEDIKLEKTMATIMNFSVIVFTREFSTNNKQDESSCQFTHSYNLKTDQIIAPLLVNGLIIGGNFLKNACCSKTKELQHISFCKQLPSAIQKTIR